jgi:SAM-dependent methyltransferase
LDVGAYDTLAAIEDHYWWHVGRLRILDEQVRLVAGGRRLRILNIGCGTGGTVAMLERHGSVVNVDVSDEAIAYMARKGYPGTTKVEGVELPFADGSFDLVAAFDVLEHIEDDVAALREWRRVLRAGGQVLVTVPALGWLWSEFDEIQHHRRRYTRSTLRAAGESSGLVPGRISYAIAFSLPLIAGYRMLHKLLPGSGRAKATYVPVPPRINRLFIEILGIEAKIHRRALVPFGTSVLGKFMKSS